MIRCILFVLIVCSSLTVHTQFRRLGVQGSSSANGQNVPVDSAWANLIKKYYKESGFIDTLHRVAASAMNCYDGMPTGYVPPPNRHQPNPSYNITRLITRTPKPTHIIVNYPSNGYDTMSTAEILFCLETIKNAANAEGIACFITSTQPREDLGYFGTYEKRLILKKLRDTIMQHFGPYAIDLWTELADPVTLKRKPRYAYANDLLHLNSAGHRAVTGIIKDRDVMDITNTWTGNIDSVWEKPANWSRNTIPVSGQLVIVKSAPNQPVICSNVHIKCLRITNGALVVQPGAHLDISN